jgi:hypothetical protein
MICTLSLFIAPFSWSVLIKQAKILYILSLEDDDHNHKNFDTLYKYEQSFHKLSNPALLFEMIKCYIYTSDLLTHAIKEHCAQHQSYHA